MTSRLTKHQQQHAATLTLAHPQASQSCLPRQSRPDWDHVANRGRLKMGRRTVLMLVAILVAALGSTLVFLYVQGINDRAIADQEPVKILTVTDTISPGESIDDAQAAGKLALTEVPKANVLPEA